MRTRKETHKRMNHEIRALNDLMLQYEPLLNECGIYLAKECTMCRQIKPRHKFYQNIGSLNSAPYCKACHNARRENSRHERKTKQKPAPLFEAPTEPEPTPEKPPETVDDFKRKLRAMLGD